MDRTANIIASYADRLRKGAGSHLYFEFNERSYWTSRFHRERCIDPEFELTPEIEQALSNWIKAPHWPNPESARLVHGNTDVVISWKEHTNRLFRTFCRMPAIAYDLEDNPIYKAPKKKARQVRGAAEGTLRCVVLVDAGCSLLRRLRPMGTLEIGGESILNHAVQKLSIDIVVVLSPSRRREFDLAPQSTMLWNVTCFDARENVAKEEYERLQEMVGKLPRPHFEGYQARDLHRQGLFAPNSRDWHLPTKMTWRPDRMTVRISAGLLHEYLAGRMDAEQFRQKAFHRDQNIFDTELTRGKSIRDARFESGGLDEDDDYVVIELDIDWGKIARRKA